MILLVRPLILVLAVKADIIFQHIHIPVIVLFKFLQPGTIISKSSMSQWQGVLDPPLIKDSVNSLKFC